MDIIDETENENGANKDMKECLLCADYFYQIFDEEFCGICQEELYDEED